ncbi:hypothetical protein LZP69_11870 [Shewanella sp. AS1]|uniref:hypothetical protein n=1 Tax=Shewanella sp. AS1 TaxID=2907626 RepID=UPI001F2CF1C4|nr:hypothetical protein [Shewanella sp. AS1]MCE9679860.1 hypothetical protein [Shewanella sp. AS1]
MSANQGWGGGSFAWTQFLVETAPYPGVVWSTTTLAKRSLASGIKTASGLSCLPQAIATARNSKLFQSETNPINANKNKVEAIRLPQIKPYPRSKIVQIYQDA